MDIESVRHRGLRRFVEHDDQSYLPPERVNRIRNIVTVLAQSENINRFIADSAPGWRVHQLGGTRRGTWSVRVSANWRITFEDNEGSITRLNLEDYH